MMGQKSVEDTSEFYALPTETLNFSPDKSAGNHRLKKKKIEIRVRGNHDFTSCRVTSEPLAVSHPCADNTKFSFLWIVERFLLN